MTSEARVKLQGYVAQPSATINSDAASTSKSNPFTAGGSFTLGRISIAFKGATKSGSFSVGLSSAGATQESTTDQLVPRRAFR